jgi:hypothetical protein
VEGRGRKLSYERPQTNSYLIYDFCKREHTVLIVNSRRTLRLVSTVTASSSGLYRTADKFLPCTTAVPAATTGPQPSWHVLRSHKLKFKFKLLY